MKKRLTATTRRAKYVGNHPYLTDTCGDYYWSKSYDSHIYRPDGEGKNDWYRIPYPSNLQPIQ